MMKNLALLLTAFYTSATFAEIVVPINQVNKSGVGESVGQVTITESKYGVVFTPSLKNLTPGVHGFHLHQQPSCEPKEKAGKMEAAGAAGGHYDPASTKVHGTPWGDGHLGDLPPLYVETNGSAKQPVLAPRLKLADINGRALMIHAGGDNHSDHPVALGGGEARIACGVIK
jgi:Cu-Zn family superoxide dismutase